MHVKYGNRAAKTLKKMEKAVRDRIMDKMDQYAADPAAFNANVTELRGAGGYRLRVGKYRVLFTIHDGEARIVFVYAVGHRRDIYEH